MKKLFFVVLLFVMFLTGCGLKTNNEIYNKVYNVDMDLSQIDEVLVPAVEKGSEATLGICVYSRRTLIQEWQVVSVGSCVVYDAKCVLEDGSVIDYKESFEKENIKYYQYKAITNSHVLSKENAFMKYTIYDGKNNFSTELQILGRDSSIDLAVVSFESSVLYIPIEFANMDEVKKGQIVVAIGNANGLDYYSSATMGIISYPKRLTEENGIMMEYIQHDAAINPGNSGGSLINIEGKLLGINTSKIVDDEIDSMGFAIPIDLIQQVLERLENGEKISKQSTGVYGQTVNQIKLNAILNNETFDASLYGNYEYGFVVEKNLNSGVLSKYLIKNDILLEVDGEKIISTDILEFLIRYLKKDDIISIKVLRNGNVNDIEINV